MTIEKATEIISGNLNVPSSVVFEDNVRFEDVSKRMNADHFTVTSKPRDSEEEAWEYFWKDYDSKGIDNSKYKNIFWRRNVQHVKEYNFDSEKEMHIVK